MEPDLLNLSDEEVEKLLKAQGEEAPIKAEDDKDLPSQEAVILNGDS